ncbi:alkaline phosphatase family protein [Segetibacter koreensis]|uniref:alkaline phosphatase family protein n=1 Tax=Segetibacter koreensis TaxID=398037 RepID=UPI000380691F|nr:alkaline phosphatase family protein [Segetibacter koreensis]
MNKSFSCICILLCFSNSLLFAQGKQKKVVFIIADGIPADVVERVHTPNIDLIAKEGKYMRAHVGGEKDDYSQTPTISAVGYNSLLTGTWVNKHNVWDNDIKEPNYNYWNIFRFFKKQYPDKKTAIFSSWTDNRTKLIGDSVAAAGNIHPDYRADGYELDTMKFPHDEESDYMHQIDETVTNAASDAIKNKAPDLSWVYLEYTDDMGHKYGDSKKFYNAVSILDTQIGKIWRAVQYRRKHFNEDWLIVITTDHGRNEQTGKDHGSQTQRQRNTWIVTNYHNLNNYAQYYRPGIVDIMPSIARFMNLNIPLERAREIDGISLIGKVSVADVRVNYFQNNLDITWKALEKEGKAKIWVAITNHFREGKPDKYLLVGEVPVSNEQITIDASKLKSSFYKVVVEGPFNTANKWFVTDDKQTLSK